MRRPGSEEILEREALIMSLFQVLFFKLIVYIREVSWYLVKVFIKILLERLDGLEKEEIVEEYKHKKDVRTVTF